MPTPKTTKKPAATFKVKLQTPGNDPVEVTLPRGAKVRDLYDAKNLAGYLPSIGGEDVDLDTPLQKGDLIRVSPKPKHG